MRAVFGLLLIGAGGWLILIAFGGSNMVPSWLANILSGSTTPKDSWGKATKGNSPTGGPS